MARNTEATIENYLVRRVKAAGGEVRKVQWIGRQGAPDRLVMLPNSPAVWVELKNPDTIHTFPANAHERAQAPDRLVMLPNSPAVWVELKNPDTIHTFPANAHERAQAREHERMRKLGQVVFVIGTREQVDNLIERGRP